METDVAPSGPGSHGDTEGSDDHFVTGLGKQQHVTPKTRQAASGKTQSKQKAGRLGRRNARSNVCQQRTPTVAADEEGDRGSECSKRNSRKRGRALFPSTSAAKDHPQTSSADVEQADSAEDRNHGANEARATETPSRRTPVHSCSQVSGRKRHKQSRDAQEMEAPSSEKKLGSKRRRLYSQPVGVIEPTGSVSGSQSGDNPSAALFLRPKKPSDTASRANESVYDQLLEHSERKSNRAGHGGVGKKKVPCGRKSAPPRVRSIAAAPPAAAVTRSSPRLPRRRAAAAAASRLRDDTSEISESTSPTPNDAPDANGASFSSPQSAERSPETAGDSPGESGDSPEAAAEANPQDDGSDEQLERGNTEVFYLPTVVPSDDDSDGEVFEERAKLPADREQTSDDGKRTTSDTTAIEGDATVTEGDYIWPSSDPDWEPNTASKSSPETSDPVPQKQRRPISQTRVPETGSIEPASPRGLSRSAQHSRRSEQRSSHLSGREPEMSGPSWMGSGRGASKTRSRLERVPCYSRAKPPSPDRSLRRYSYLTGVMPEKRVSSAQRGGRSRSRSGSRGRSDSARRLSGDRSSRPSPRRAARPFFSVEPDTDSTSAAEVTARSPRRAARPFFSVEPDTESTSAAEVRTRSLRNTARPFFSVDPDTESTSAAAEVSPWHFWCEPQPRYRRGQQ